jgi:glutathione peroxidase
VKVLGFPCNQFGAQEPGSNQEILDFATSKYQVNFPMFAKLDVNGNAAAPLYQWLCEELADEEGKHPIAWNFAKFLIDKTGKPVKRYHPKVAPEDIAAELDGLL